MVWIDLQGLWPCRTMGRVERVGSYTEPIGIENSKCDSRGNKRFSSPSHFSIFRNLPNHPEDGGNTSLRNFGINQFR
jgi:hypothetical protein